MYISGTLLFVALSKVSKNSNCLTSPRAEDGTPAKWWFFFVQTLQKVSAELVDVLFCFWWVFWTFPLGVQSTKQSGWSLGWSTKRIPDPTNGQSLVQLDFLGFQRWLNQPLECFLLNFWRDLRFCVTSSSVPVTHYVCWSERPETVEEWLTWPTYIGRRVALGISVSDLHLFPCESWQIFGLKHG